MDTETKIRCKKTLSIISKNIRHFRVLRNMSQTELGLRAGVTASYITDIEASKHDLLISTISSLAYALEIPVYELFVEDRKEYLSKPRIDKVK